MKYLTIAAGLLIMACLAAAWAAAGASPHTQAAPDGTSPHKTAEDPGHEKASVAAPAKSKSQTKDEDAAVIARQKPAYPLDTCVVRGNNLKKHKVTDRASCLLCHEELASFGEHVEAVDYVYKGRLIRLCCKDCIAAFEKDPEKYLAKLDEAAKAKEKAKAGTSSPKSSGEAGQGPDAGHSHHDER